MLTSAVILVLVVPQLNANRMCGTTSAINKYYGLVQNTMSVALYFLGFAVSLYVNNTIPSKRSCTRQEIRQLKTMIAISSLSLCFVALPNCLLIENSWGPIQFSDLVQGELNGN
ncbi:unnamed protein product, partial [Mesorhabditis spiculigera]